MARPLTTNRTSTPLFKPPPTPLANSNNMNKQDSDKKPSPFNKENKKLQPAKYFNVD